MQILIPSAAVSSHKPGYKLRWIIYFPDLDNASSENTLNFSTIVSLLRQAESLLSLQALSPANQVQSTEGTSQSTLILGAGQSQTDGRERLLAQFRTLFSRYSSPSSTSRSSFPAPSLGQARLSSGPPSKCKKSNVFVVKETWAHNFFCLANHRQEQVPSRAEKFQLQDAGLGRKTSAAVPQRPGYRFC